MTLFEAIHEARQVIAQYSALVPEIAIVLGSGLGPLADDIASDAVIPYEVIPNFHTSTAPGHSGQLILGTLAGRRIIAMKGRLHLYDGLRSAQVAFPIQVMHALGAKFLLVSNACGGLNPAFRAGGFMLQLDMINFSGDNPLVVSNDDRLGPRFPVMYDCYDPDLIQLARSTARQEDIQLFEGVYLAVSGPNYATRAELRMYRSFGADAIGMSTVHEVIAAKHLGMRVLGISSVTDMALPDHEQHATGAEVVASANQSGPIFRQLVKAILPHMA
jgi:purine-nucleoside phosphorylase